MPLRLQRGADLLQERMQLLGLNGEHDHISAPDRSGVVGADRMTGLGKVVQLIGVASGERNLAGVEEAGPYPTGRQSSPEIAGSQDSDLAQCSSRSLMLRYQTRPPCSCSPMWPRSACP